MLRVQPGLDLAEVDPHSTPGFDGKKKDGEQVMEDLQARLSDLQERLFAESKGGGRRSVLLVIQGMDTSGKGGIMRHVVGAVDPQGVAITAFKAPSRGGASHPFLWRIRNALPRPGQIGVFDRSHYEDVLIVRVHELVPRATWARRYAQINHFEERCRRVGDHDRQGDAAPLAARSRRPGSPSASSGRTSTGSTTRATSTSAPTGRTTWRPTRPRSRGARPTLAPWHVVPADRKWYARLAVTNLLLEALEGMDPQWPAADFDVEEEQARLAITP